MVLGGRGKCWIEFHNWGRVWYGTIGLMVSICLSYPLRHSDRHVHLYTGGTETGMTRGFDRTFNSMPVGLVKEAGVEQTLLPESRSASKFAYIMEVELWH